MTKIIEKSVNKAHKTASNWKLWFYIQGQKDKYNGLSC